MLKTIWLVKNLCKMAVWIALGWVFISWLGLFPGVPLYAGLVIAWALVVTLVREYQDGGKAAVMTVIRSLFSTDVSLPFTAYGCYCSPKYGVDGRTNGLIPVDELDAACKKHDTTMLSVDANFQAGYLSIADRRRMKNQGDRTFMREALVSDNRATGVYLLGLEIAFAFRIFARLIFQ